MTTNYIDEIMSKFDKEFKPQNILITDFGNAIDKRDEKIKTFIKQKLQEVQQRKVEDLKEKIQNAKTVKSEMEEMESKDFSDGYQKALEDILLTN